MLNPQDQALTDCALNEFLARYGTTNLTLPISYLLQIGGKRLRPGLVLAACRMFGGKTDLALPAAVAVELFHNFTLMHDDIMDRAHLRRGHATVHEKWNTAQAILSGDAMLVQAYMALAQSHPPMVAALTDLFSRTAYEVCLGQQMDMDFEQRTEVAEFEYLEMIRLKTSVLVGAALQMGAIGAVASAADEEHIYNFGVELGMAFQLRDDYLDAFGAAELTGKQVGGDILAGKKTYLMIRTAQRLGRALPLRGHRPESDYIQEILAFYRAQGADADLLNLMGRYFDSAMRHLDHISTPEESKDELRTFAVTLMQREH